MVVVLGEVGNRKGEDAKGWLGGGMSYEGVGRKAGVS